MENYYAKAVAAEPAYKNHVKLVILNSSENTVSSQIASLQTAIRAKPNALLIDAVSSTALNATVQQACNAGIVVYSFDQGITAPCAYKLLATPSTTGDNMAYWMGTALKGKGDVWTSATPARKPLRRYDRSHQEDDGRQVPEHPYRRHVRIAGQRGY